jgi:hypothetical protein
MGRVDNLSRQRAIRKEETTGRRANAVSRQAILVLGMHRSGTSAFAGGFGHAGLQLPATALPEQPDNPRGFHEPARLLPINDRALALCGTHWYGIEPIGEERFEGQAADALVAQISTALAAEYPGPEALVVKDPRICRLMPLWKRALAATGMAPRIVLPLRNPFEVAQSLKTRNGFPVEFGLALWLRYVLDAEHGSRGERRCFVRYQDLIHAPAETVDRLGSALVDGWSPMTAERAQSLAHFIDADLNHEAARSRGRRRKSGFGRWLDMAEAAHARLLADPANGEAEEQLDHLRAEFNAAASHFAVLITDMAGAIDALVAPTRTEWRAPGWQENLSRVARDSLRRLFQSGRA